MTMTAVRASLQASQNAIQASQIAVHNAQHQAQQSPGLSLHDIMPYVPYAAMAISFLAMLLNLYTLRVLLKLR